jgi:hypothetical protein
MINELKHLLEIKNWKFKIAIFFILTTSYFILNTGVANAQTAPAYDVTVSPIFLDLSANPGDTITTKVRIRNNTTSPITRQGRSGQRLTGDLNGNLSHATGRQE